MNTKEKTHLEELIKYCVSCNPEGVRSILINNNLGTYDTPHHMRRALLELVRRKGIEGVIDMLEIHPDKNALEELNSKTQANESTSLADDAVINPMPAEEDEPQCGCDGHGHETHENGADREGFIAKYVDGKEDYWLVAIAAMTAIAMLAVIFKD